ncbi:N(6)-adenine-specific methyltransferase METTL4 [Microplitis demolitor]|uniref:N(6)-adenine-specific methyltransferase METTL4 n=1 Tax=Microplitis demolitor TaxID=69319 RepID=UPI0004CD9D3E|nr:N(6)-adenine-specific methyltransferase METTL4 [Microplitis demolitor]
MSILSASDNGWIISHSEYLNKIYHNVNNKNELLSLEFDKKVFYINSKFLRSNQILKVNQEKLMTNKKKFKKKKNADSVSMKKLEEINFIKETIEKMLADVAEEKIFNNSIEIDYNKRARDASHEFYDTDYDISDNFYGFNQSDNAIITTLNSNEYVFPNNCYFYSHDIKDIDKKLEMKNQFDFILMDPPWWNKFIRRNKTNSYKMMFNEEINKIPVNKLLNFDGIIAIWCTNSQNHYNYIIDVIFPLWGIKYLAKWYWVKVTKSGETICDFSYSSVKQPFEFLIFGCLNENLSTKIPDKKIIMSVPSAIHSHKPPIVDVLKLYLPPNPNCLEIFARYLLPGWTSWGLEVLKFQQLSLYSINKVNV